MTRQIVLDTETTGLNFRSGNRIIEIGCVELVDRKLTGNNFHRYINPGRDSEDGALAVHGLTTEFLSDKPTFEMIIQDFIEYISGAEIVIHNAPFDVGFLNAEFALAKVNSFEHYVHLITDTLVQAKEMYPGKKNSLDALCSRYEISNSHRKLHGALLDAELLADVFLAMSRGQDSFEIEHIEEVSETNAEEQVFNEILPSIFVLKASNEELEAHGAHIQGIEKSSGSSFWNKPQN